MKTIYFMRHGLTELNEAGLRAGSTETPLTKKGREQAKQAGEQAKSIKIDTIVCSTQGRARETADIVAKEIDFPKEQILHSSLLIERHFGELEGQPYKPDLDLDGFADVESTETILNRARLALEWIESLPGDSILIVSHSGFGRALRHVIHRHIPFTGSGSFNNAEIVKLRPQI